MLHMDACYTSICTHSFIYLAMSSLSCGRWISLAALGLSSSAARGVLALPSRIKLTSLHWKEWCPLLITWCVSSSSVSICLHTSIYIYWHKSESRRVKWSTLCFSSFYRGPFSQVRGYWSTSFSVVVLCSMAWVYHSLSHCALIHWCLVSFLVFHWTSLTKCCYVLILFFL